MNDDVIMNGRVVVNLAESGYARRRTDGESVMTENSGKLEDPWPPADDPRPAPKPASAKPAFSEPGTRKGGRPGTWNRLS